MYGVEYELDDVVSLYTKNDSERGRLSAKNILYYIYIITSWSARLCQEKKF